jgi:adenylate cyclase
MQGEEQQITILFADIRGFTTISENKLPYDVVFMLNRYFRSMGEAIETAGGRVDKFIGDGIMALFGVGETPQQGSERALRAAREMAARLDDLNDLLAPDLAEPLRIGIGIHTGAAIVGEMGYGEVVSFTAVGDSVNTASRLEAMTKQWGAQLVVSEDTAALAGIDLTAFPKQETEVRGRQGTMTVRIVADARDLPDPAATPAPAAMPPERLSSV